MLKNRLSAGEIREVILALGNDLEGGGYLQLPNQEIFQGFDLEVTRIGFGLPSGGGVTYADEVTLRSALKGGNR